MVKCTRPGAPASRSNGASGSEQVWVEASGRQAWDIIKKQARRIGYYATMSKSGARILVVDDEIEILRALQRNLTAHGYEVFTASSGEQALEEIVLHRPDLMLLDLGLPGMSGLEG